MARIVAEKSESSFLQVIHSAGVPRFGEAQPVMLENNLVGLLSTGDIVKYLHTLQQVGS
jgi:hypothetical protein